MQNSYRGLFQRHPNLDVSAVAKGSATLDDAQATDLTEGRWYLNLHTAANPDGEIRGGGPAIAATKWRRSFHHVPLGLRCGPGKIDTRFCRAVGFRDVPCPKTRSFCCRWTGNEFVPRGNDRAISAAEL